MLEELVFLEIYIGFVTISSILPQFQLWNTVWNEDGMEIMNEWCYSHGRVECSERTCHLVQLEEHYEN